jgi:2-phosphoglycerate kinase
VRVVLVGGAPGIGKTTVARRLLDLAARGTTTVQHLDVDALWLHQPWRVDDQTKAMVQANLAAVLANAVAAGIDVVVVTWVFQDTRMHELVRSLTPADVVVETVQLVASEDRWRARFESDRRPPIDAFYESRYAGAQSTPADHRIDTDDCDPEQVAALLAVAIGL